MRKQLKLYDVEIIHETSMMHHFERKKGLFCGLILPCIVLLRSFCLIITYSCKKETEAADGEMQLFVNQASFKAPCEL